MAAARMPQQARSQHRRDALLDAAAELLAEGGVAAVTHRAVAARAGLPPSTPGYFFASIDDLAAEALRVYTERAVAEYVAVRASALRGDDDDTDRMIEAVARRQAHPAENASQVSLYLQASRNPTLAGEVRRTMEAFRHFAEETLAAAGVPDAKAASPAFVALFDGYMLHTLAQPDRPAAGATFIEAIDSLLTGYLLDEAERRAVHARLG